VVDFTSVIVSVGVTITIQSLYYALVKFPPIFRQETHLLQKATRVFTSDRTENNAALKVSTSALDILSSANDILLSSSSAQAVEQALEELMVVRAKLIGLESCKDPIRSHIQIVRAGLSRTIEQLQIQSPDQEQVRREALSILHTNKSSLALVAYRSNESSDALADELEVRAQNLDAARFQLLGAALLTIVGLLALCGLFLHLIKMHVVLRSWEVAIAWLVAWIICGSLLRFSEGLAKAAKSIIKSTEERVEIMRKEKLNLPGIFFNEDRG
jgi:hypothetical protein